MLPNFLLTDYCYRRRCNRCAMHRRTSSLSSSMPPLNGWKSITLDKPPFTKRIRFGEEYIDTRNNADSETRSEGYARSGVSNTAGVSSKFGCYRFGIWVTHGSKVEFPQCENSFVLETSTNEGCSLCQQFLRTIGAKELQEKHEELEETKEGGLTLGGSTVAIESAAIGP